MKLIVCNLFIILSVDSVWAKSSCKIELESLRKNIKYTASNDDKRVRLEKEEDGIAVSMDWKKSEFKKLRNKIQGMSLRASYQSTKDCPRSAKIVVSCDKLKEVSTCVGSNENKEIVNLMNAVNLEYSFKTPKTKN